MRRYPQHRRAQRIEENLEAIAVAESWDNGNPVRETLNADIPLAVDHFRYFAGAIRDQEGSLSHAVRVAEPDSGHAGAGRQEPEHQQTKNLLVSYSDKAQGFF